MVKTDNIGLTYISGGNPQQIRVEPDPEKLALFGVTLQQFVAKVRNPTGHFKPARCVTIIPCEILRVGNTPGVPDIGLLLVGTA